MTFEHFYEMPWYAWPLCIAYVALVAAAIAVFWRYRHRKVSSRR